MIINFSPRRGEETLVASVDGDKLTVNGVVYDFTPLAEGSVLPDGACGDPFVGPVGRVGGEISLTLVLPHGANPKPSVAFPETVKISKGQLEVYK